MKTDQLWGLCQDCRHHWLVLTGPMDAAEFCRRLRQETCPACGADFTRLLTAEPPSDGGSDETSASNDRT